MFGTASRVVRSIVRLRKEGERHRISIAEKEASDEDDLAFPGAPGVHQTGDDRGSFVDDDGCDDGDDRDAAASDDDDETSQAGLAEDAMMPATYFSQEGSVECSSLRSHGGGSGGSGSGGGQDRRSARAADTKALKMKRAVSSGSYISPFRDQFVAGDVEPRLDKMGFQTTEPEMLATFAMMERINGCVFYR